MKKFLCALLCFVLMTSTCVSAAGFDFLTDSAAKNYSAKQTMTLELKEPLTFVDEELLQGENVAFNLMSVLTGFLEQNKVSSINTKCSEDYKQLEISVEAESQYDLAVNANLDLSVRQRSGFWLKMDLRDAQNPVFLIVYSDAKSGKYIVLDLFAEAATEGEESKAELYELLNYLFDARIMKPLEEKSIEIMQRCATVQYENGIYTLHMDNAQFGQYLALVLVELVDFCALAEMIEPAEADVYKMDILMQVPGMQWLGESGYTVEYSLTSKKKLQRVASTLDLDVYLADVLPIVTLGEESWDMEDPGRLALLVKQEKKIMYTGENVTVTYPELTEENSISYAEYLLGTGDEVLIDEQEVIPNFYAEAYTGQMPVLDGVVYVPLRALLESAYGDAVTITYSEDGKIVIESEYFKTITTHVGGDSVSVDGGSYIVGDILLCEDTTYVSRYFFEYLFDWQLWEAHHDLVDDYYYCLFVTSRVY